MKSLLTSLTMRGAMVQFVAPWLLIIGVGTQEDAINLLNAIFAGGVALAQLIGFIMTYFGRKRANANITLTGAKK
mgnify:CR=1 FL=1